MTFSEYKEKYGIRLNTQQQEAVLRTEGNTLLLAVPGSGKTTVIVSRLGYMTKCLGIPFSSILTLTYSVASCRDMKERYISVFGNENVPQFRTIHGICAIIIKEYERVKGTTAFELFDGEKSENALISECFLRVNGKYPETGDVGEIKTAMTYVRNMMMDISEINSFSDVKGDISSVVALYEAEKRRRRLMDYDDQLEFALKILNRYPSVLQYFRRRYPYINVDEAQDTSKIQHEIIRLLSSGNLFMVGDEDQSIYGFRAAYPAALLDFEKTYTDAKVMFMEQNFRSTGLILKRASRLIANNRERREKHMFTGQADGRDIEIVSFPEKAMQYEWLLKIAEKAASENETTAVLFRNNDSALLMIDKFEKHSIPYRYREAECPFFEHRGIADIFLFLNVVYNNDADSFRTIAKRLGCGLDDADAEKITVFAARKRKSIAYAMRECIRSGDDRFKRVCELSATMERAVKSPFNDGMSMLCDYTSFARFLNLRFPDISIKINILKVLARQCHSKADFDERIAFLHSVTQSGSSPSENAIILSTVHSSKGLEYDNVIITDVRDGEFPCIENPSKVQPKEIATLEEERRLFYVAVTRARKSVRITSCAVDFDGKRCARSTFVSELMRYDASLFDKRKESTVRKFLFGKKESADASEFACGRIVVHAKYGEGTIEQICGDKCTVAFENGEKKSFSLKLAVSSGFMMVKK